MKLPWLHQYCNKTSNTFIDGSTSAGSFNTHKTNINIGHTTKKGLTVQLNAYQNYSDNNYKVKTQVLYLTYNRQNKKCDLAKRNVQKTNTAINMGGVFKYI